MAMLPRVADGLEVADFDTELVVLVPQRRAVHMLETGAALVFDSCRRGHSRQALQLEMATAIHAAEADLAGWIDGTLDEFARRGLVDDRLWQE